MAKVFVNHSSCIFSVTIFVLLLASVGLLVFVLKGQLRHAHDSASNDGHVKASPALPKGSTHTPSPQTAPKPQVTGSTAGQSDLEHTTLSSNPDVSPWEDFRLPKYIIPLHYDLLLYPNIPNDTFTGSVNITVNVTKHTNYFMVHAYRLLIKDSKAYDYRSEAEIPLKTSFLYDPHEYYVVESEKTVSPGIYKLYYKFFGSLLGSIVGFYKSRYRDRNNQTRYLATSKFQPTYARRAFPCYDEPSFKSTFTVSLVHEPGYVALSNMPVDETKTYLDTELLVTKFQTSVPMVTYLACFIVCDFDFVKTTTSAGKEFRVYAAPDQINKTEYALKFGSRVLEYFENYFGIDYPLPKQDMVAIPDFVSGAMEHWGVITFRETNLLYDKENSSPRSKQRVSTVISHEMTHMWFGNLVTMEWWDDLWLNEGFASYVEYKGVHEQHPDWDILSQFVTEDVQPVMDLDSTMSSHPIVQPVKHPDEITEIFDDISYGKGASVLRMLEFFVGKENFRQGISQFLKKYQFTNAKTSDLWAELSEACGYQGNHTIASIMKTWTEQMGFPFISVKRIRQDQNVSIFIAEQNRFVKNEELYLKNKNSTKEYSWSVPLSYVTEDDESDIIWIHDEQEMEFEVPVNETEWVKFNVNQTGYYLVNYEKEEWDKLIRVLTTNHELLTPSDRSNLLFDSFLLGEAGHIPFDVFLSMSKYLKNETHLIPWETAYHSFVYLCQLLEYTDVNFLLKSYVNDLTEKLYKKLGWKSTDSHIDNLLRTTIIGLACHSGNRKCLSDAAQLFQNWTLGQEVPSSLRTLVYHYGMSEIGQEEHWNYMWNKYLSEDAPSEKKTLLYGLAHVRVPSLIHRYLEYAMDDQKIRRQDFFTVLNYIAGNPVGRPFVWNFLREKWPALVERFTLNDRYLGLAVKKICSYFTTDSELEEMNAFFTKYPDAGAGKRRRQQALENVLNNIKWLKTYKQSVKTWLEIEGSSPWYYHRLPPSIVPEHYDLLFYPKLDDDIFIGSANITVSLNKTTDCFLVHAVQLNVTDYDIIYLENNSKVEVEEMFQYEDNDYLVLKVGRKLPVGKYKLRFEYEGPFTVSFKGLYKSTYVDPETTERKPLATTQFESIAARKAFPCFDEPRFKSTFSVRIRHDADHFALSNTEAIDVENLDNGLLETTFEKSLPMVSYLLCIVVCDFKYKETITDRGLKLRVYTAAHQIEGVDYALDISSKMLDYYERYFDVHFPLKKLDMITVPDFLPGGMENWGLITFDEKAMLISNESSVSEKYKAADIIAHELAHMWFGDLVTMTWWDDLWLNEGFATYMSQKGISYVEPEFDLENYFFTNEMLFAMLEDQTVNSHPVVQTVTNAKTGIFSDTITYSKGSSVLGMLEKHMGDDFRKGVSAYLKKHKYSNAVTKDLWNELTAASTKGLNVTLMMETWTKQMNYPYLTVKRKKEEDGIYEIQQHRFLEDPSSITYSNNVSPYNYVWQIPVTYRSSNTKEIGHIFINSSDTVSVNASGAEWVKFNVNFTGYYSVNYDTEDWLAIMNVLTNTHQTFRPADRINLLFDSFSFASAGILDYEIPLNMTNYLKNETYYGAWEVALKNFEKIKRYFKNDKIVKDLIKEHVRSLCKNLVQKFSWTNSSGSYSQRKLKSIIIDAACNNGHHECLVTAGNLFNQWKNGIELDPEIREVVVIHGLRVLNDDESWEFVWQKYVEESDVDQKDELQKAMILVRNASQIERFIDAAKNESFVRKHDYLEVLRKIANNERGFFQVTSLLFKNWTDLIKIHGSKRTEIFAYRVFKLYDTEKDLKKVREFYRRNKVSKYGQRFRTLTIERILLNIRWQEMHKNSVKKWFENNVYMPWRDFRLPRYIRPSTYNITLYPNITQCIFEGSEEIAITISKPTDYILLHEIGLKIFNTELISSESGESVTIDEIFPYNRNNFHVIFFDVKIPEGEYFLRLDFTGTFGDFTHGITRYSYTRNEDSIKRYLMATKFEPTDARRMFPCFDEPSMKAKFTLTLIHEENFTALSNMPVESQMQLNDNMVQTTFEESVEMSTYLLCCVICDFDYIETEYKGKKVRVYVQPDRLLDAEHGLNTTVKALEKYEEYLDVPYALPKLDSVIIPRFKSLAMEHWGVITYKEESFLVDETTTSYSRMARVDKVITHELAHQWFGNLVTMKWWNDVWLNEGFSSFIMYMPLRENYPQTADQLEARRVSKMMCIDSVMVSHPIQQNISSSTDINRDLFDRISYEKGGAVLKMLQYILNDDFRKGLSNYLKKYAFKNVETRDLWDELSNASSMDLNITDIMNTWTQQRGFPYIELKRESDNVTATQRWFLRKKNDTYIEQLSEDKNLSPFGFIWKIPLIYKNLATGNEHTLWLNERNATFHINAMRDDILKFNPGFVGCYIVKYDDEDYQKISKRLQEDYTVFSVIDRYNLLYDAFLLADSDRLLYDIPLEFTKYLKKEKEHAPWAHFGERFAHFLHMLDGNSETVILFKEYVRLLTQNLYDEIVSNKNDSSHFRKWLRPGNCEFTYTDRELDSIIIDLACHSQNEKCLKSLNSELQLWIQGKKITADLDLVFNLAIPYAGNSTLWNILYEKFNHSNATEDERTGLIEGFVWFTGRTEIMKTIEIIMEDPSVKPRMARNMFESLGSNPVAVPVLWNYAKRNWDALLLRFDAQNNPTAGISTFCNAFKTLRDLGDFIRFLKTVPQINDYIMERCIEDIQEAVNWSEKYEQTVQNWLRWNLP